MANKKLQYPAQEIDDRLEVAHTHNNKDALDQITATDAENIKDIENKADITLDNVENSDFKSKAEEAGVAFEDVADNDRIYGRQNGAWVDITSRAENPEITSDTLDVTTTDNVTNIELPSTTLDAVNSIEDKIDKVIMPIGNIVSSSGSGNLQDSGIATTDVVKKSELADDVTTDDPDIAPSTALTHDLYELISGVSGGIGQTRGSVYHAFNNSGTTDVYTISTVSVDTANAGTGYIEGSLLGYSGVIDASFIINEVDDGAGGNNKVVSVSLETGGMFESNIPSNITPYGGGESATGLHLNVTTITTARTTLNNIENPVKGDTAYVMQDELHNDSRSIWMYTELESGAFGWTWLTSFAPESRNFITDPIQTNEIQDEAVTAEKLEPIPSNTVLANVSTSEASPQPVSTDELFSKLDVVTGVKGQAEADYRSGEVVLSPQDIGWSKDNILVNSAHLKTSTSGSDITIDLSDEVVAQLGEGELAVNEQYFINEAYQSSTRLSLAATGIKIIADQPIVTYPGSSTKYPASTTPPPDAHDDAIATTSFVQDVVTTATTNLQGQIQTIAAEVGLITGEGTGSTLPYFSAGIYNMQLSKGTWQLECWGAQGGGEYGGLGGYASVTIVVTEPTTIFIVAGSQPTDYSGGFNGGGHSASYSGKGGTCWGYGGGGATHIALVTGVLSSLEDNKDQILVVAGGGGGGYYYTDADSSYRDEPISNGYGGYGGGEIGGDGGVAQPSQTNPDAYAGRGGTQTEGGTIQQSDTGSKYNPTPGSFGQGGNGNTLTSTGSNSPNHGGAGGGGWYGGSGGSPSETYHSGAHVERCFAGGGGGSGHCSLNSDISSSTVSIRDSANILTPGDGVAEMPSSSKDDTAVMYGNKGSGVAKVTYIDSSTTV